MTNKKSKFLTFFISLIPGAGEMYLGFYKMGISLMALFAVLSALSGLLNSELLILFLPVIWFYSFFHVHNLNAMSDEEFYALEDNWLFRPENFPDSLRDFILGHQKFLSYFLIFLGAAELWQILNSFLYRTLQLLSISEELYYYIHRMISDIPQILIGIGLIYIGYLMIKQKKETLEHSDNTDDAAAQESAALIPSPPYSAEKSEKDCASESSSSDSECPDSDRSDKSQIQEN